MTEEVFCTLELDAETGKHLTLGLFVQVQNYEELRQQVIRGDLKCCFLKTAVIADPFQVIVAANKATLNEKYSKLVTRNVFTEILYNLSTSKNITQSLITFGASANDTEILVAIIHDSESRESQIENIVRAVKGKLQPLAKLENYRDVAEIKKLYKIDEAELRVSSLVDSIVSRISARDFVSMK